MPPRLTEAFSPAHLAPLSSNGTPAPPLEHSLCPISPPERSTCACGEPPFRRWLARLCLGWESPAGSSVKNSSEETVLKHLINRQSIACQSEEELIRGSAGWLAVAAAVAAAANQQLTRSCWKIPALAGPTSWQGQGVSRRRHTQGVILSRALAWG